MTKAGHEFGKRGAGRCSQDRSRVAQVVPREIRAANLGASAMEVDIQRLGLQIA
jgi:hypothetical protein